MHSWWQRFDGVQHFMPPTAFFLALRTHGQRSRPPIRPLIWPATRFAIDFRVQYSQLDLLQLEGARVKERYRVEIRRHGSSRAATAIFPLPLLAGAATQAHRG